MENEVAEIELETDETTAKRCRLPRRQTVQSKKFCAKEERNASIKKVNKFYVNIGLSIHGLCCRFQQYCRRKKQKEH